MEKVNKLKETIDTNNEMQMQLINDILDVVRKTHGEQDKKDYEKEYLKLQVLYERDQAELEKLRKKIAQLQIVAD